MKRITEKITFSVSPELKQWITDESEKKRMSVSAYIRTVLELYKK